MCGQPMAQPFIVTAPRSLRGVSLCQSVGENASTLAHRVSGAWVGTINDLTTLEAHKVNGPQCVANGRFQGGYTAFGAHHLRRFKQLQLPAPVAVLADWQIIARPP